MWFKSGKLWFNFAGKEEELKDPYMQNLIHRAKIHFNQLLEVYPDEDQFRYERPDEFIIKSTFGRHEVFLKPKPGKRKKVQEKDLIEIPPRELHAAIDVYTEDDEFLGIVVCLGRGFDGPYKLVRCGMYEQDGPTSGVVYPPWWHVWYTRSPYYYYDYENWATKERYDTPPWERSESEFPIESRIRIATEGDTVYYLVPCESFHTDKDMSEMEMRESRRIDKPFEICEDHCDPGGYGSGLWFASWYWWVTSYATRTRITNTQYYINLDRHEEFPLDPYSDTLVRVLFTDQELSNNSVELYGEGTRGQVSESMVGYAVGSQGEACDQYETDYVDRDLEQNAAEGAITQFFNYEWADLQYDHTYYAEDYTERRYNGWGWHNLYDENYGVFLERIRTIVYWERAGMRWTNCHDTAQAYPIGGVDETTRSVEFWINVNGVQYEIPVVDGQDPAFVERFTSGVASDNTDVMDCDPRYYHNKLIALVPTRRRRMLDYDEYVYETLYDYIFIDADSEEMYTTRFEGNVDDDGNNDCYWNGRCRFQIPDMTITVDGDEQSVYAGRYTHNNNVVQGNNSYGIMGVRLVEIERGAQETVIHSETVDYDPDRRRHTPRTDRRIV